MKTTIFSNYTYEFLNEEDYLAIEGEWDMAILSIERYLVEHICIVKGVVSRWNGFSQGYGVILDLEDFEEMIRDCDYVSIEEDEDTLYIKASHHDGTNSFEIKEAIEPDSEALWFDRHSNELEYRELENMYYRGLKPSIDWYL